MLNPRKRNHLKRNAIDLHNFSEISKEENVYIDVEIATLINLYENQTTRLQLCDGKRSFIGKDFGVIVKKEL